MIDDNQLIIIISGRNQATGYLMASRNSRIDSRKKIIQLIHIRHLIAS